MSISKEVKARMTSLGKQTYTPHGWGKEVLISRAVGGCWGEDRLGRGWMEEEKNLGLQKQGQWKWEGTILFRNDRSQAGRGRRRKCCLAEEKNQKISKS